MLRPLTTISTRTSFRLASQHAPRGPRSSASQLDTGEDLAPPRILRAEAKPERVEQLSYRPAEAQGVHLPRTGPQERLGARAHRRAGSEHVVDQRSEERRV